MQIEAGQFVHGFRQAGGYIHRHRGRTFVLAVEDETLEAGGFDALAQDIALLHALGIRVVVVHGARSRIDRELAEAGIESRFVGGVRVTTAEALERVRRAAMSVHVDIQARLSSGPATTPSPGAGVRVVSGNFVTARPLGVIDGVDFAFTGQVRRLDTAALEAQLAGDGIVLLSNLGFSPTGEVFNLAAEDVAVATAGALNADKLIFLAHGLEGLAADMAPGEARERAADATLPAVTRRHLASAAAATEAGVRRVHLVRAAVDGALLLELFTRDGAGTLVTAEAYDTLRPATIEDVGGILALIAPLEAEGALVRRSREQLELEVERFRVIERDGAVIGCVALFPFPGEGVAEMAALAVHPDYRGARRGERLLERVEQEAREAGLERLFVLTTRAEHWFVEHGFAPAEVDSLPVARRELYNYRRNSKVFVKPLVP